MKSKTRFTFPAIAQNILFYFEQYLVRGVQFSEAGLIEWGPDEKKK